MHELEISAFYSPKIEEATKTADELQAKVDGTGFRLALCRIWRGRKDREELAHLRHEITACQEKVAEQRKAFSAIHQREKDELDHLHGQRMHHLRQTFMASREREQDSPRLLGTGRRVALETAEKRRAKAIQKRAYERPRRRGGHSLPVNRGYCARGQSSSRAGGNQAGQARCNRKGTSTPTI